MTESADLSLTAFARELTHRANSGPRFRRQPDTLAFAVRHILASPLTLQSLTLAKFVVALCGDEGSFRAVELYALDAAHTDLAADLIEARRGCIFPEDEWTVAKLRLTALLAPHR